MALKQRLNVRHQAASQVPPVGKRLMVRKQGSVVMSVSGDDFARSHPKGSKFGAQSITGLSSSIDLVVLPARSRASYFTPLVPIDDMTVA